MRLLNQIFAGMALLALSAIGLPCIAASDGAKISSVVSAADFNRGITFSGYASLFGIGLADAPYIAQGPPWPTKLGPTQVFVCPAAPVPTAQASNIVSFLGCTENSITYVSPTQINFLVPSSLPSPKVVGWTGDYIFVVTVNGNPDQDARSGNSLHYSLSAPQPRIFSEGFDCFTDTRFQDANKNCGLSSTKPLTTAADRGAVTDQQGKLLWSSNPSKLGQYYTIWMTGLGSFTNGKPAVSLGMSITNIPVYGYKGDTWMTITPSYVGASSEFPGLYQVNFQLPVEIATSKPEWNGYPPMWPCGEYSWEVSLSLWQGSASANLVQIPIVVKNGDVTCAQIK